MMEIITTFKGNVSEIANYQSIVIALEKFSIAHDFAFSNIEAKNIIEAAKAVSTKVYVLCNKMIFDEEIEDLTEHLNYIKSLDVDGIYFGDIAVFMVARQLEMQHLLIYSPGMTIVNSFDVKEYLELGIQAVELANEITLKEKIEIAKNNPHKVGVVISGYMLMSYSKRLALSNYFNEIDKKVDLKDNFDLRLVEATRKGVMPIYEDAAGTYIYSEYILDSLEFMQQLLEVDFKYFRIDGIFLDKTMIYDLYKTYADRLTNQSNADMSNILANKYPDYKFDNIFYTTETSEVK